MDFKKATIIPLIGLSLYFIIYILNDLNLIHYFIIKMSDDSIRSFWNLFWSLFDFIGLGSLINFFYVLYEKQ